ncbi:MAG: membrane dipeptidase [Candidatus Bathyarchaeia archaeon]
MENLDFKEAIIVDCLNVSVLNENYFKKMKCAGVTAINYTVAASQNLSETIKRIFTIQEIIEENNDKALLATKAEDVLKAKNEGKVAIFLGFQGVNPLEGNLAFLKLYKKLGIRIIQPSYHFRSIVCDGCLEKTDCGLSLFGVKFVEEMNKLGMLIDLAHVGKRSTLEIIEISKDPVIFSHSNARALVDTYQNKTDEEIKALAEKGGVICVSLLPRLLGERPNLNVNNLIDHIEYIVNLVGSKHVGIGTDLVEGQAENPEMRRVMLKIDGKIYEYPKDIDSISKFPKIIKALLERGFSKNEIKDIIGGNFLRVAKQVLKE